MEVHPRGDGCIPAFDSLYCSRRLCWCHYFCFPELVFNAKFRGAAFFCGLLLKV
jgi:hypothetical protein